MIKPRQDIWVEKLTLPDIFTLLTESFFSNIVVYYDENKISLPVRYFLSISKKIRFIDIFSSAVLRLDLLNSNNEALHYQYKEDLDICTKYFCSRHISDRPDWFQKMTQAYAAAHIDCRVRFITMVQARLSKQTERRQTILIARHPLNYLIVRYYRNRGFKIRQSPSIMNHAKDPARTLYLLWSCILSAVFTFKPNSNIKMVKPSIWIEYEANTLIDGDKENIENKLKNSTFFWSGHLKARKYDLVYYIDRPDTPVKDASKKIAANEYKWIDFTKSRMPAKLSIKDLKEVVAELLDFDPKLPIWFYHFKCAFFMRYKLFYSIYKRFKVKVLVEHQENSWIPCVQAKAIEEAGGIMIGFHWSHSQFYRSIIRTAPYHVYFIWGKIEYERVQKSGDTCRYILPSGLWIQADDQKPSQLSDLSGDSKFVLAIFDTGVGYDSVASSAENFSRFYQLIVKLLETNPRWAGIVKSKKYELDDLPVGDELRTKIRRLAEQRRMIFMKHQASPVTAASRADLSVCLNLNSAGIVSAIHGCRAVHWDSSGWKRHFFYKDNRQKFLFNSLEGFEQAILKAGNGDKEIGDFSGWSRRFNYFDDHKAPIRVGGFIRSFMEDIIKTEDVGRSLSLAVKEFIRMNKVGDDFFKVENIWETE